jgi:hypothetical protein
MRLSRGRIAPRSKAARGALTPIRRRLLGAANRLLGAAASIVAAARRAAVRVLRPLRRRGARALRVGERQATPARGLVVVALAAAVALGGSQFTDFRAVEVGAPAYAGVEAAAPAPEIDRRSPRSAHGAWVLAIAVAATLVVAVAVTRNWRLARLLIFLGAAVVAISIAVDAPQGLREGSATTVYQGADAVLLGGFWVQLASGVTLVVVGPLLALELRAGREGGRPRARRGSPGAGRAGALATSSSAEGGAR